MRSLIQREEHHETRQHETRHVATEPGRLRYAVYYTPQPGSALAAFGRSWFGRANDGATLQAFSTCGLDALPDSKISPFADRYLGLHAPFVSPCALREDTTLDKVKTRLANFAGRRKKISTGPLKLARAGRSLVLRPAEPRPEVSWLALQCFNAFESFAAKPDDTTESYPHLSVHQQLLLRSLGQSNVMSEFRFSIRLTGPLDPAHLNLVSQALHPLIADVCAEGVCVDGLSLIADSGGHAEASPLRLIQRYTLAG